MDIRVDPTLEFDAETSERLRQEGGLDGGLEPAGPGPELRLPPRGRLRPRSRVARRLSGLLNPFRLLHLLSPFRLPRLLNPFRLLHLLNPFRLLRILNPFRLLRWFLRAGRGSAHAWLWRCFRWCVVLSVLAAVFLETAPPRRLAPDDRVRWVHAQERVGQAVRWPAARGVGRRARTGAAAFGGWGKRRWEHAVLWGRSRLRVARRWWVHQARDVKATWDRTGQCVAPRILPVQQAYWWQAARPWIHVRRGPGTRHGPVALIGRGALARIEGGARRGWLPVRLGDGTGGYVKSALGVGLGRLSCGRVHPGPDAPVCRRPERQCREVRRTRRLEQWAAAPPEHNRPGWQAVYLAPADVVYLPEP